MKRIQKMMSGFILFSAALFVTGCSAGNADSENSGEKITKENVEASMEGEKITIGTSGVFAPFSYYEADGTTLTGYDIDLLNELQTLLGYEVKSGEYQVQDYAPLVTSLTQGKIDVAAAALCATSERQKVMDFTEPYLNSGQKVMINNQADTGITGVDDLSGKTVAVEKGTASHTYAQKNLSDTELLTYDKISGAYEALNQNKVDAVIQDAPNVTYYVKTNPDTTLAGVGDEFNKEEAPYAVALAQDSPYKENFEVALEVLAENGTLAKLQEKWLE
ncbi:ABC transporter substrate-binding protein [Enterococcus sp. ALS3]|uniref:ABC transporter substrate-binding protein n=1 Tax=Enterococcus alishanensis TaxID=1303817 RepID=A0ABS6THF6_9ENTE|nr:ABC transporter substrate-binding protein [Enterococcus alishanensis]MBV7392320.1 ABC transporter substrate-binding protein [Enterococcus alishanensis]